MHDRRAMEKRPHFVYQLWAERQCLYIGITAQPAGRMGTHARKFWWKDVERIEAQRYPSRREALLAEATAIEEHQPAYNWMHADLSVGSRSGRGHGGVARVKADHMPEDA